MFDYVVYNPDLLLSGYVLCIAYLWCNGNYTKHIHEVFDTVMWHTFILVVLVFSVKIDSFEYIHNRHTYCRIAIANHAVDIYIDSVLQ